MPKAMTKAMTIIDKIQVTTMPISAMSANKPAPIRARQPLPMRNNQSGFTLIEIMVVIVILAILAGLVVPKVVGQSDKARVKTTETALATVSNALDMYKVDNSRYPTTAQGLEALTTPPAEAKNYPDGGYIKGGYPTDGWENGCNMSPQAVKVVLMIYSRWVQMASKAAKVKMLIFMPNYKY